MTHDDLDRALGKEQEIVPSSGFAGGVMDAVRREALTLAPIPFPWKRVAPAIAIGAIALVICAVIVAPQLRMGVASPVWPEFAAALHAADAFGVRWVALALLVSFVAARLSRRAV